MDEEIVSSSKASEYSTQPQKTKHRRKDSAIAKASMMPRIDQDVARRHTIAYFYALYSNCNCDACKALKPIAKKMIEGLEQGV